MQSNNHSTNKTLPEGRAWTLDEMASYCNTTKVTLRAEAKRGRLNIRKIGKLARIFPEDREAYFEAIQQAA